MQYTQTCCSPLGTILLASDGDALTGLWVEGQKYFGLDPAHEEMDLPVFDAAKRWLALYFSGTEPDFTPKLAMFTTPFRKRVWETLQGYPGKALKRRANTRGLRPQPPQRAQSGAQPEQGKSRSGGPRGRAIGVWETLREAW